MGQCVSKPAEGGESPPPSEGRAASNAAQMQRSSSGDQADKEAPSFVEGGSQSLKLMVNEEAAKMTLGRTASGRVVVEVERNDHNPPDVTKADELAGPVGSAEFEALKVLERMGLGVQFSPGDPFIGQLELEVVEVTGLAAPVPRPYVVVSGESDKSVPKPGEPASEGGSIRFSGAKFVFFVLFSNSRFSIRLKGQRGVAKFVVGQASLEVGHLKQGSERGELDLLDGKGEKVGTVKVDVSYLWLRGTRDDGTFTRVNRVILTRKRPPLRRTARVDKAAIELVSQVNHWLLSHDNVYRVWGEQEVAPAPEEVQAEAEELGAELDAEAEADAAAAKEIEAVAQRPELRLPDGDGAAQLQCSMQGGLKAGAQQAQAQMMQSMVLETLAAKEGDSSDVAQLKQALLVVLAPMLERISDMDVQLQALTQAVQQHQLEMAGAGAAGAEVAPTPQQAAASAEANGGKAAAVEVTPFISGHFEHGMGRPASWRSVFLFMRKAHLAGGAVMHPEFLGTHRTNWAGNLGAVPLPPRICRTPGHYEVIAMLPDDFSSAKGSLFVLQPGTKAVVFDLDGTITVGDSQVVTQFGLDALGASTALNAYLSHKYDLRARRHALQMVRAWAAKGYQPIYLSGRQGSYYNLTLKWLIKHRYPPGPIHLTRTHMPTLPVYFSVGMFKVKYLESLKAKGIQLYAAYGNTTTDIKAYEASGIPKERTYIIGPHGGKGGTVKVANWTDHLPEVLAQPNADVPIPYTELLISERPGYWSKKKVRGPDGALREVSTVETVDAAGEQSCAASASVSTRTSQLSTVTMGTDFDDGLEFEEEDPHVGQEEGEGAAEAAEQGGQAADA